MVNGMKNSFQFSVFCCLFAVSGFLLPVFCYAEELADPTKPPVSISAPVVESGAAAVKKAAGLQSILISKNRRAAIIDGVTVELGGRIDNATLVEVNAAYVVLKTNKGRRILNLFPDVKITRTEAMRTHPSVTNGEKK